MQYPSKLFQIVFLAFTCMFSSGCFLLLVGSAGAVGGYAISRDTVEGVSSKGQDELMTAARQVVSIMGIILDERRKDGEIEGTVAGSHVYITVIQINMTTSKLRVKARNGIFPRIGTAQEVYTKIMNQLQ